jgi:hypothetical protein
MQQFSEETYKLDEKPTWLRYENSRLHSHHENILFTYSDKGCNRVCFMELGLNCYASSHGKISSPIYNNQKVPKSEKICFMLNSTYSYSYGL